MISDNVKEKLEYIKKYYVKNYTDEQKEKLFNNLNKKSYVQKTVKGYTAINKLKAKHFYGKVPYDLLYNYNISDVTNVYIESKDKDYLVLVLRWVGLHNYKLVCGYNPKYVFNIFDKFSKTKNYYDFSCGWGKRLLCSLGRHINYYGTDPNTDLCCNLNKMVDDYRKFANDDKTVVDIRNTGSEVYHKDWENKMDLCFSSPPYFNLEVYEENNDNQSIHNRSFEQWIEEYIRPTVRNCYKYLKDDGYLVINISNTKTIEGIEEKVHEAVLKENFEFVEKIEYWQTTTKHDNMKGTKKTEKFYVYKKKL